MNRLRQAWVWLRRINHCRGFGIQSPTDYRFVRYVVNEHWPYHAYDALGRGDDWLRRKLGQLYFRLANDVQPHVVADLVGVGEYVQAGCRRARLTGEMAEAAQAQLIVSPPRLDAVERLLAEAAPGAMLVVEDIGRSPVPWQAVVAHPRAVITFDLYYCGIALLDQRRPPQHYIVNF